MVEFDGISVSIGGSASEYVASIRSAISATDRFEEAADDGGAAAERAGDRIDEAGDNASGASGRFGGLSSALATTTAAADRAEDASDSLRRGLGRVGEQASDAARGLGTFSAAAGTATASTTSLSAALGTASLSAGTLGGAISATTVAVGGLLTTLAPLVAITGAVTAGLAGVAGAASAVVGTGLLAFGEQRGEQAAERLKQVNSQIEALEELEDKQGELTDTQEEQLESLEEQADTLEEQTGIAGGLAAAFGDLREEIAPLLVQFGEQFIPLVRDGIEALPTLVERVLAATGSLEPFVEALRDLGGFTLEALPAAIGRLADLARRALPVIRDLSRGLVDTLQRGFETAVRLTERFGGDLVALGGAIGRLIPTVTRIGAAVLDVAVGPLTTAIDAIGDFSQALLDADSTGERVSLFVNAIGDVAATATSIATDFVDEVVSYLQSEQAAEDFEPALDALVSLGDSATTLASDLVGDIADYVASEQAAKDFELAIDALVSLGDAAVGLAGDLVSDVVDVLGREETQKDIQSAFSGILSAGDEGFSLADTLLSDFESFVTSEDGKETIRNLGKTVGSTLTDALELGGGLLVKLTEFLVENLDTIRSIARALGLSFAQGLLDGVVAGIQNGQNSVAAAVFDLAADAINGLRETLISTIAKSSPGIDEETARSFFPNNPATDLREAAQTARAENERVNASALLSNILSDLNRRGPSATPAAPPTGGPGGQVAPSQRVDVAVNAEVGTTDDVATVEDVQTEVSQQSRQQERRVERLQRRGRGVGR